MQRHRSCCQGAPVDPNVPNIQALGTVLYTRYLYIFEAAGLVLLVAMIGQSCSPTEPAATFGRRMYPSRISGGRKMRCDLSISDGRGGSPVIKAFPVTRT
jgi:hypothetical protein